MKQLLMMAMAAVLVGSTTPARAETYKECVMKPNPELEAKKAECAKIQMAMSKGYCNKDAAAIRAKIQAECREKDPKEKCHYMARAQYKQMASDADCKKSHKCKRGASLIYREAEAECKAKFPGESEAEVAGDKKPEAAEPVKPGMTFAECMKEAHAALDPEKEKCGRNKFCVSTINEKFQMAKDSCVNHDPRLSCYDHAEIRRLATSAICAPRKGGEACRKEAQSKFEAEKAECAKKFPAPASPTPDEPTT